MPNKPKIIVKHKLLKEKGKIKYRRFKDIPDDCYQLRIYVEGDTDTLQRVEYELHPSFHNPLKRVNKRRGGFPLDIWTWGEFDIAVTFVFKDGSTEDTIFSLEYSDELPAEDDAYIDVSPNYMRRANS